MTTTPKKKWIKNLKWKIGGTVLYLLFWWLYSLFIIFLLYLPPTDPPLLGLIRKYGSFNVYFFIWLAGIFASWWWITINKWIKTAEDKKTVVVIRENESIVWMIILWFIKTLLKMFFSIIVWIFVAPYKFYELFKDDEADSSKKSETEKPVESK